MSYRYHVYVSREHHSFQTFASQKAVFDYVEYYLTDAEGSFSHAFSVYINVDPREPTLLYQGMQGMLFQDLVLSMAQ